MSNDPVAARERVWSCSIESMRPDAGTALGGAGLHDHRADQIGTLHELFERPRARGRQIMFDEEPRERHLVVKHGKDVRAWGREGHRRDARADAREAQYALEIDRDHDVDVPTPANLVDPRHDRVTRSADIVDAALVSKADRPRQGEDPRTAGGKHIHAGGGGARVARHGHRAVRGGTVSQEK